MLSYFLFILLITLNILIILWGLKDKNRTYSYPFLISLVYCGFIVPQVIGLLNNDNKPESGLNLFLLISLLSLVMCYVGWKYQPRLNLNIFDWTFSSIRLKTIATLFTVIGILFYYLLSTLPSYMIEASNYSGLPVAYLFFANLLDYGIAIFLVLFLTNKSLYSLILLIPGVLVHLFRAVSFVRRADTIEIFIIFLTLLWFIKGKVIPRYVLITVFTFGIFILYSTGDIRDTRTYVYGSGIQDFLTIDYKGNIEQVLSEGGVEVTNAVMEIAATELSGNYDFGLFHWNMLVFNYVPAQLLGVKFKESLYANINYEEANKFFRYNTPYGSTVTGFVDAFKSFWLFGIIKFFIISFILGFIYRKSEEGKVVYQLIYALLLTASLHTVTHHTHWFIIPLIHMSIFLLPALFLSRTSDSRHL